LDTDHNVQYTRATDVGLVRDTNEDCVVHAVRDGRHLFVLADGMGGLPGGEVASFVASEAARDHFLLRTGARPDQVLQEALLAAHRACREVQVQRPDLSRMGTTLELALVDGRELWWGHVGDSRQYLVTDGGRRCLQITVDHTLVQGLVDQGILSPDDARHHPHRNLLSSAVGTEERPRLDLATEPLVPGAGDCLVQCSDGLSDLVLAEEIGRIVGGLSDPSTTDTLDGSPRPQSDTRSMPSGTGTDESPDQLADLDRICASLIDLAKRRGGHDNITIQIVRWVSEPERG
jgi:serine/threonine protein phosphatase PrpC